MKFLLQAAPNGSSTGFGPSRLAQRPMDTWGHEPKVRHVPVTWGRARVPGAAILCQEPLWDGLPCPLVPQEQTSWPWPTRPALGSSPVLLSSAHLALCVPSCELGALSLPVLNVNHSQPWALGVGSDIPGSGFQSPPSQAGGGGRCVLS